MSALKWTSQLGLMVYLAFSSSASPAPSLDVLHARPADPALRGTNVLARVFIFVSNDCPISNRYCPEIRRLHDAYAPRGIAFWLVHSDAEETLASVQEHDREYNLNLPCVMDPDHALARHCQAEIIPSVAVFAADGRLLYRGRIDDRFAELGRERPQPSRRDLQGVIEAILAHRPVTVAVTKAVGCYMPKDNP